MGMKEDLDDPDAIERLRFHMFDIIDRYGSAALKIGGDAIGLLGLLPAIEDLKGR